MKAIKNSETKRKQSENHNKLAHYAYHDYLTGLPNRFYFEDILAKTIARVERINSHIAVLLIDLDHFKQINDTHGHQVGDEVLKATASRMQNMIRKTDTLARTGGDEFLLLVDGMETTDDINYIAGRLVQAFHEPVIYQPERIQISLSIGISIYNQGSNSMVDLIQRADKALYGAKTIGRDCYQLATIDKP